MPGVKVDVALLVTPRAWAAGGVAVSAGLSAVATYTPTIASLCFWWLHLIMMAWISLRTS